MSDQATRIQQRRYELLDECWELIGYIDRYNDDPDNCIFSLEDIRSFRKRLYADFVELYRIDREVTP